MPTNNLKRRLTNARNKLNTFFANNPYSEILLAGKYLIIENPWNDDSIVFVIWPSERSKIIKALNNLVLSPSFTAIYHVDTNTMEYIYTRLMHNDPILSRNFIFSFDNMQYSCKYDHSSERLMTLVDCFARAKESKTDFRNLVNLEESTPEEEPTISDMIPVSFYVSGFKEYNENEIKEVSKYLNFFMLYYDRGSPIILMHSTDNYPEQLTSLQFIEGGFPNNISTRHKDPLLMDFILAACTTVGSRLQFIYCYQILEYAAFYYIDYDMRRELINIISTPDIHSDPDKHVARIIEIMSNLRIEDEAKINKLVKSTCNPEIIYQEIEHHRKYFTTKHEFEGGFVLDPFISEDITKDSFNAMWHPKTIDNLRLMRNALVHGREKRFGQVINPTQKNDDLIKPWCCIVRRLAEQVVLYG